jgi:hypothetical protein
MVNSTGKRLLFCCLLFCCAGIAFSQNSQRDGLVSDKKPDIDMNGKRIYVQGRVRQVGNRHFTEIVITDED